MFRILLLVLSGLLFAGNLQALSTATDKQQPPTQAVTQKQGDNNNSRKSSPPAATFTPTEKVGAGSAVSFPADI